MPDLTPSASALPGSIIQSRREKSQDMPNSRQRGRHLPGLRIPPRTATLRRSLANRRGVAGGWIAAFFRDKLSQFEFVESSL